MTRSPAPTATGRARTTRGPAPPHLADPPAGLVAADYDARGAWLAVHCGSPAVERSLPG
ncbi:MAG TPA: hypothetical protein VH478_18980 [Trebonia sp.]|nr:hypothetical protein [Trebonia sp.]